MAGNKFNNDLSGYLSGDNDHNNLSNGNAENKKPSFETLFYMVWGYKWIILAIMIVCVGLAYLYAKKQPAIYKSSGTIMISAPRGTHNSAGNGLGTLLTSRYGVGLSGGLADQAAILRSRKLSKVIADTLIQLQWMKNGKQYPVLYKSYPDDSTMLKNRDAVAARLRSGLSFERGKAGNSDNLSEASHLISVSFTSPARLEAQSVVNLTIEKYIRYSINRNRFDANSAVSFLGKELKKRKHELQQAGQKLQRYMQKNNLVSVDAQTQAMIERSASLVERRQDAQNKLIKTKAGIAQYKEQLNDLKPGLADQFAKAIGPNMSRLQFQLSELETNKTQLLIKNPQLKKDGGNFPRLQDLNRKIGEYKDKIHQLTKKLLNNNEEYLGFIGGSKSVINQISSINQKLINLQVEKKQYESLVNILSNQINKLNKRFNNLPRNITAYAQLKQNVALKKQLYMGVSKQYANMKLWQQTQFGPGKLLDRATLPGSPIMPRTKFILVLGLMVGGILGLGFVFIKESFSTKIDGLSKLDQFDEVPARYTAPLLAAIPDIGNYINAEYGGSDYTQVEGKQVSTRLVSYLKSISLFAESFRELETGIIHSNTDKALKTVAITSSTMGEGKSIISSNLGVIMAEAGHKAIIVDTDLRRPKIHKMFGIDQTPGISDILFNDIPLEETIKPTVAPNLSIITAGQHTPNPASVIKNDRLFLLLEELENDYDIVIIDTQPFGIISDSLRIMNYVDGVVVVTRFKKTQTIDLQYTLNKLHRAGANVLGMVLNGFDPKKSNDYSHSYYHKLYSQYEAYSKENDDFKS